MTKDKAQDFIWTLERYINYLITDDGEDYDVKMETEERLIEILTTQG